MSRINNCKTAIDRFSNNLSYFILVDSLGLFMYLPAIIYGIVNNVLFHNFSDLIYFIAVKNSSDT